MKVHQDSIRPPANWMATNAKVELGGGPGEVVFAEGDFQHAFRGEDVDRQAAPPEGDA